LRGSILRGLVLIPRHNVRSRNEPESSLLYATADRTDTAYVAGNPAGLRVSADALSLGSGRLPLDRSSGARAQELRRYVCSEIRGTDRLISFPSRAGGLPHKEKDVLVADDHLEPTRLRLLALLH